MEPKRLRIIALAITVITTASALLLVSCLKAFLIYAHELFVANRKYFLQYKSSNCDVILSFITKTALENFLFFLLKYGSE